MKALIQKGAPSRGKQKMMVLGLTGGIGMGKSTVAAMLRAFGFPVHSADEAVHALLGKGGAAVRAVAKAFPESLKDGAIDREILGQTVFHDPAQLERLEAILHPLARKAERAFVRRTRQSGARAAILEIPLLFETGAETRCDAVLCVTAPRKTQKERVLRRPGMTEGKFRRICARQMTNAERLRRADHVIPTGTTRAATEKSLRRVLSRLNVI